MNHPDTAEHEALTEAIDMRPSPYRPQILHLPFDGRLSAEEQRMIDEGQLGAFRSDSARRR